MEKIIISKNKSFIYATVMLAIFYSNFSYGDSVSGFSTIEKIQPLSGGIYIHLSTGNNDSENCGGSPWSYLLKTTANYNVSSSTILYALQPRLK